MANLEGMFSMKVSLDSIPKRYPVGFQDVSESSNDSDSELELPSYITKERLRGLFSRKEDHSGWYNPTLENSSVATEKDKEEDLIEEVPTNPEEQNRKLAIRFAKVDGIMEKSVLKPGFEQLERAPAYIESKRKLKKLRKKERAQTKGPNWYNLPATELTEERKRDLEILKMRSVLDPKRFYKDNDLKVLPKYFQVGKVVEGPADFYSSRLTKKERKNTLVDELLADAEFRKFSKKRHQEILTEKRRRGQSGAHKHAKRMKKKKT